MLLTPEYIGVRNDLAEYWINKLIKLSYCFLVFICSSKPFPDISAQAPGIACFIS